MSQPVIGEMKQYLKNQTIVQMVIFVVKEDNISLTIHSTRFIDLDINLFYLKISVKKKRFFKIFFKHLFILSKISATKNKIFNWY